MKSKITGTLLTLYFCLSTFLVVFYFFSLTKNQEQQKQLTTNYQRNLNNKEKIIKLHRAKEYFEINSNKLTFNENITLKNRNNDIFYVKTFLKNYNRYTVLRLKNDYCLSCYEGFLKLLSVKIVNFKVPKLIILASFNNNRELKLILDKVNLGRIEYFTTVNSDLLFETDNHNSPYLFKIRDNQFENFFAIDKSYSKNFENYIDVILKK